MVSKRSLHSKAILASAFGALVVAIVGAGSALGVSHSASRGCSVVPATSNPFLNQGDSNSYFLAPGGNMESDLSAYGWTLSAGAGLVTGNEPQDVSGNPADAMSLAVPDGGSVMTPAMCVTIQDPTMRFFAVNSDGAKGSLSVSAYFVGSDGKPHVKDVGGIKSAAGSGWMLSDPLKFKDAIQPGPDGTGLVSFVFTAKGNWQIDDLYIDPLKSQ